MIHKIQFLPGQTLRQRMLTSQHYRTDANEPLRAKTRVLCVFGTRPEAIKMAPVISKLRDQDCVECIVCVTGQHRQMLDQVLDFFGIAPDCDLNLMKESQSLGGLTSSIITNVTTILRSHQPHRVIVHGDTTTTLAASLASFYERVPVGHVEAGLRTGDLQAPWPEELNRRFTDIISDMHWAPTKVAAERLLAEGVQPRNVFVTGNTVVDALIQGFEPKINVPSALQFRFYRFTKATDISNGTPTGKFQWRHQADLPCAPGVKQTG
jgi:UDP-N-acetylglucosamine 2-epimerase